MAFEQPGYRRGSGNTSILSYRLEKLPLVIRLIQCGGNSIYLDTLYFRKDRKALNKQFGLYFEDFYWQEHEFLKIDSNFILSVEFPVTPIKSHMSAAFTERLKSKDSIYAASYLIC
jgi:hypothetical protein